MIRNLIGTKQYVLVNNLDIVEGGPWTFIDRQDGLRKSCLDLIIVSINLLPFITKVEVDNKRKFTPRRVMKRKDKIVTIFSDHFSTKVEMKGIPRVKNENSRKSTWNIGKPGGWDRYNIMTNQMADKVSDVINNNELNIDDVMKKIDKIETKIKFAAFGKTKPSFKNIFQKKRCKKCQVKRCDSCPGGCDIDKCPKSYPDSNQSCEDCKA